MDWYKKSVSACFAELESDPKLGLGSEEAKKRLERDGKNALESQAKKSFLSKLIDQFKDPMIIILMVAVLISVFLKEYEDAIVIVAIVVVNAVLSLYQEGKAEEAIAALQKMASPNAKVLRDGIIIEVPSENLVVGDVVELETGAVVPADLRLIESANLKIDEASLTGESVPAEKFASDEYDHEVELGDRTNMSFSSSIVSYGRGMGIVVATGINTEIGKIAHTIASYQDEMTPLQKKLAHLSKTLGIIVIAVCALVFGVGFMRQMEVFEIFMISVSLAVAAIPEGLPAIVTIVLSLGMGRMAQKNAIVKKLLAVETLGTTTVICSDKTGTLTQNQMTVTNVFTDMKDIKVSGTGYEPRGEFLYNAQDDVAQNENLRFLLKMSILNNDAKLNFIDGKYSIVGDPTEGSLVTLAGKLGYEKEAMNNAHERIAEIPFDSDRKMMSTFHKDVRENKVLSFTKGAPDVILENCDKILIDNKAVDLTPEIRKQIEDKNFEFSRQALRVLAFAYNEFDVLPAKLDSEHVERNMVLVGLLGMIDPPRDEVRDAIAECKTAGIIPIMITGDHVETAFAIARDLKIVENREDAMMGKELNNLTHEQIREVVKTKRVFARVSPQNKVQIVSALKDNGHIAAMTGDGVNDAPAIKKSDIGIAMGITGTDVAKNTAEVILTDDNFATIVAAVKEGRIIYANIKKFVAFLLSCNIAEIMIVLLSILFGLPVPLIPIQLLWLNLVTDSFPALALGVEAGEDNIMEINPRDPKEPILDRGSAIGLILQSVAITISTLSVFIISLYMEGTGMEMNHEYARSMAFVTLICAELFRSYSIRNTHQTLWEIGVFSNKMLVWGTMLSFALTLIVVYIPFLANIFGTMPLSVRDWVIILPFSLLPLILGEVFKLVRR